jgi:hypothetical protein
MSDYLLVFQLPETFFVSIDDMHAFEQKMMNSWPKTCQHDGHDIGNGSINFFVFTAHPQAAFLTFRKYLGTNKVEKNCAWLTDYVMVLSIRIFGPSATSGRFR